mmetsp:Transcript_50213/g.122539  ORF Transcript_50213/g.122539 Transcript_50213/m.122539 type:complete len:211 (-) Transcript_50213:1663-2295(-)
MRIAHHEAHEAERLLDPARPPEGLDQGRKAHDVRLDGRCLYADVQCGAFLRQGAALFGCARGGLPLMPGCCLVRGLDTALLRTLHLILPCGTRQVNPLPIIGKPVLREVLKVLDGKVRAVAVEERHHEEVEELRVDLDARNLHLPHERDDRVQIPAAAHRHHIEATPLEEDAPCGAAVEISAHPAKVGILLERLRKRLGLAAEKHAHLLD